MATRIAAADPIVCTKAVAELVVLLLVLVFVPARWFAG